MSDDKLRCECEGIVDFTERDHKGDNNYRQCGLDEYYGSVVNECSCGENLTYSDRECPSCFKEINHEDFN